MLRGHGLRERQVRGPPSPGNVPCIVAVRVRRFHCRLCRTTVTVVPSGVLGARHFSAGAIGWALGLFGLDHLPLPEVRRRVSPWPCVGAAALGGWATLRRWLRACSCGTLFRGLRARGATARATAEHAAAVLAAHALPVHRQEPLASQAFYGAVLMA